MKQPTPRKGTETPTSCGLYVGYTKQPTPRKGTETLPLASMQFKACETTHTPQGDGNRFYKFHHEFITKQPTPRKGTETHIFSILGSPFRKQPTPRKGTETYHSVFATIGPLQKQPTPRKGTETTTRHCFRPFFSKQPTPRKGTETRAFRHRTPP